MNCAVLAPASARAAVSLSRASIVAGARGIYGIGSGNELSILDNIRSARHKTVDNERDRAAVVSPRGRVHRWFDSFDRFNSRSKV